MAEIAIIGCGPAGLLAAHAVARAGHVPVVYSNRVQRSPMAGGVYLHEPVPGLAMDHEPHHITFHKQGKSEVYATKVYGTPEARTSWLRLQEGPHPAWPLAPVYDLLWALYGGSEVHTLAVDHKLAGRLVREYPLVVNSAPMYHLCRGDHSFPTRPVWYVDDAPGWVPPNTMIYNGNEEVKWFRTSDVFGKRLTEFSMHVPLAVRTGIKVQATTCTCHPDILRVGRWGTWTPGVLLHHAFRAVTKQMERLNARAVH